MSTVPKEIHTRQIAIAAELGYGADVVVSDSFDAAGMTVLGSHPEHGRVFAATGEHVVTHVRWPSIGFAARALEAKRLDFEEMFGGKLASRDNAELISWATDRGEFPGRVARDPAAAITTGKLVKALLVAEAERDAALAVIGEVRAWERRYVGQWIPGAAPSTFDRGVGAAAHDILTIIGGPDA